MAACDCLACRVNRQTGNAAYVCANAGKTGDVYETILVDTKEHEGRTARHADQGSRCLVYHPDHGSCVLCSCGEWVAPDAWAAHVGG